MARGKGREQDGGGLVRRETDDGALSDIDELLDAARRTAVRSLNAIMTAAYWSVGRRIVEEEQRGGDRARYGDELIRRLAKDLGTRFGRGFGVSNLKQMRAFYVTFKAQRIGQTVSGELHEPSRSFRATSYLDQLRAISQAFPLPWSHYVRILAVKHDGARQFYEDEALRGGWTVRQLARQIDSMFYERTVMSRDQAAVLRKGRRARPDDHVSVEEAIKDPLLLEFLDLPRAQVELERRRAPARPRRPRRSSRAREGRLAWAGAALWSRPWPSARSPRSDTRCCASAPAR